MVSLDAACTRTNENQLSSIVGMTCVDASVGAQDPPERVNSASKSFNAKRDSGRLVRKRRSSGAGRRKKLGSPAISSKTGEQDTESQKPPGCASMYGDSPDRPVHQDCVENQEALISCVVLNGDSVHIESLVQKSPSNKKHGQVQKARGKLNVVVEESGQSEPVTEESNTEPSLAPWQQADFNIDDILKPVAKSRGSVRRSLRNRRSVDLQAEGLVWVDHTSPEVSKASRRKTRGRLSGVSELLLSQVSEEPAPNFTE